MCFVGIRSLQTLSYIERYDEIGKGDILWNCFANKTFFPHLSNSRNEWDFNRNKEQNSPLSLPLFSLVLYLLLSFSLFPTRLCLMGARRTGPNKIFVFVFRFKTTNKYKSNDFTLGKLVYSKHLSRVDQVIIKQFQFFLNTKKMSETRRPLLSRHESCEDQEEVDEIVLVTIRQNFWNCNCVFVWYLFNFTSGIIITNVIWFHWICSG